MKNLILTVASLYALNVSAQVIYSATPSENMNSQAGNYAVLQKTADNDFREYVNFQTHKLSDNERRIVLLKKLASRDFVDIKYGSAIASCEKENSKLKADLAGYAKYGSDACWMSFKGRFDVRITPLRYELASLEITLKSVDHLAATGTK